MLQNLATLFLDTSALVKLYIEEDGTKTMLRLASREEGHRLTLLALARVEFAAAVRRRERSGDLDRQTADELQARLEKHLQNRFLVQPVTDRLLDLACSAVIVHPLRAYDALQLAGCLVMKATLADAESKTIFVCADGILRDAAKSEGLEVLDPESG